ncbi:hypothetical protein B5E58_08180 [Tyzzerella sp. An114]|uniref:ATP-binding protein n=1 Tax=Tyzzerella sp. An114 TaxID=1965545 RepID=UPI000B4372EF|nr:ATP-binding protein [Tyzzerella sp. An114]OUQ57922.1 hypothetical protein B5E58_08180 [Tyzzerella sp. An114]HIT72297.1 ATP-binding protein [Candidatus Fimicola cottocaccae]
MSGKTEIYKEVLRDYERLRSQKSAELREKQTQLYKKFPRLADIEREMNITGVRLARLILEQPVDYIQKAERLRKHTAELKTEKLEILRSNRIPENFLELSYNCTKCHDTGFIDGKECTCFKQKLVDKAYDQSNLKDIIKNENFDFFDIRYYSTEKDPERNISPRENIQDILAVCIKFTQDFDKKFQNLLLYGKTGLGKTFLCNCMAKELLDSGKTVMYVTASQLFKLIEEDRFNRIGDEDIPSHYMDDILSVDLFIIDDLGTEFSTILSSAELFNIINTRLINRKPVVISTNLSMEDIINQYSDRIVSRIVGSYTSLEFFGDDIRMIKKFDMMK